jgi:hypothetical protein
VTQPQQDPRVQQVSAATLGAATVTQATAAATTALIGALWPQVNPYNKTEVARFTEQAGRILISSQRTVANAHTAAQQLQLRAMGVNQPVTVTVPDNPRGATVDFTGNTPKVSRAERNHHRLRGRQANRPAQRLQPGEAVRAGRRNIPV